jgi:hypothetical protein
MPRSFFHVRGHDQAYDGRSAVSGQDLHRALRTPQPVVHIGNIVVWPKFDWQAAERLNRESSGLDRVVVRVR